jgi:nucleoside-diphosphate-sugar epimerase
LNLLVGATGFVGGHVVEYLFQQGEISKGVFRKGSHLKIMDANGVQGLEADLLDHHSLHEAMEGADVVYNLASPMPDSDTDFQQVNTEGLLNLLEVATESKAKAFVHLSTVEIFGFGARRVTSASANRPNNEYQKSKAEAERILLEFAKRKPEPRVAIIRSAKAVGSRDESVVVPILRMIGSGKVSVPRSGVMSFSHPRDIAQAMFKAASGAFPTGSVFQMKSFDATIDELARGIVAEVGARAEVRRQGMFSGSHFPKYATEEINASLFLEEQQNWKQLGYEPQYPLKATCEEIASWYRRDPWSAGRE